jgi:hypothetical protein
MDARRADAGRTDAGALDQSLKTDESGAAYLNLVSAIKCLSLHTQVIGLGR